jgi:hypothetical protein
MQIHHEAVRLRIFIGESDRWHHHPLYEAIVLKGRTGDSRRAGTSTLLNLLVLPTLAVRFGRFEKPTTALP